MNRRIPFRNTTTAAVIAALLEYWVYAYGVSQYTVTKYGKQLAAKLFDFKSEILGSEHYLTTAFYLQTNGQPKQLSDRIIERLQHYLADPLTGLRPVLFSRLHVRTGRKLTKQQR